MWKKIRPFVISIAIALAVGGVSALITKDGTAMYQEMPKPALSPPQAVFPIVWTVLFILMGISAALVYKKGGSGSAKALAVYALQLFVNFFWSILFFNLQSYLFSFIWIVLLWLLLWWMIYEFLKISPTAAYLQIPYLLWVTFAGYLNYMVYMLNK